MVARTTHVQFITNLAALIVTGVNRRYLVPTTPPALFSDSDLPIQYVPGSTLESNLLTYGEFGEYWTVHKAQLIIAASRIGADTGPGPLYDRCLILADALNTALEQAQAHDTIANEGLEWNINVGRQEVAEGIFWGVVANVSTRRPM